MLTRVLTLTCLLVPTLAWATPRDDARRHFQAGLEATEEGETAFALQHFLAAQRSFPDSATLFNIARAYQTLGEPENALVYYRQYQRAEPEKSEDVASEIRSLELQTAAGLKAITANAKDGELGRLTAIAEEIERLTQELQAKSEPAETAPAAPELFKSEGYERQVVTANRLGQNPLDSPSTISVVAGDDLRMSGAVTLVDALRHVPGIDVMTLASGQHDVSIRGFNRELNNRVLILVDGRSTYTDFTGATLWNTLPIVLDDIERVEVIRGPGSALYGANAFAGVINIITRTPDEPRTVLRIGAGSTAYARASATTCGVRNGLKYRLSGAYDQLGRWARTDFSNATVQAPLASPDDLGKQTLKGGLFLEKRFGKAYLSGQAGLSQTNTLDYVNIGALGDYVLDDVRHHTVRIDGGYDHVHVRAFWNHDRGTTAPYQQRIGALDLTAPFRSNTYDLGIDVPVRFEMGPLRHQVTLGVGVRHLEVRFGYLEGGANRPFFQNHFRAFLDDQITIGPVKVSASVRLDRHPLLKVGETLSPRLAAVARIRPNTSVRATFGQAFRQPTSIESYMDLLLPTGVDGATIRDVGNLSLAPERITTLEVGVNDQSSLFR